jgi:hypothetical protein
VGTREIPSLPADLGSFGNAVGFDRRLDSEGIKRTSLGSILTDFGSIGGFFRVLGAHPDHRSFPSLQIVKELPA